MSGVEIDMYDTFSCQQRLVVGCEKVQRSTKDDQTIGHSECLARNLMAECSVDPKIERFAFEVPGAE